MEIYRKNAVLLAAFSSPAKTRQFFNNSAISTWHENAPYFVHTHTYTFFILNRNLLFRLANNNIQLNHVTTPDKFIINTNGTFKIKRIKALFFKLIKKKKNGESQSANANVIVESFSRQVWQWTGTMTIQNL